MVKYTLLLDRREGDGTFILGDVEVETIPKKGERISMFLDYETFKNHLEGDSNYSEEIIISQSSKWWDKYIDRKKYKVEKINREFRSNKGKLEEKVFVHARGF